MAQRKNRLWGFDDGEREILVAATAGIIRSRNARTSPRSGRTVT
jgi:hypothetical protein